MMMPEYKQLTMARLGQVNVNGLMAGRRAQYKCLPPSPPAPPPPTPKSLPNLLFLHNPPLKCTGCQEKVLQKLGVQQALT